MVREGPILFSAPMVRAILDGTKTQTRRPVKPQPIHVAQEWPDGHPELAEWFPADEHGDVIDAPKLRCPYGAPGDRLWVRETFFLNHVSYDLGPIPRVRPTDLPASDVCYRADGELAEQFEMVEGQSPWRPSIHMPRWASRITLEVTRVRVERLCDGIDDEAVRAEGFDGDIFEAHRAFRSGWDAMYARKPERQWHANPWVWVVEFNRVEGA